MMCAYNKVNSVWCSENKHLLRDILKDEWGFDGLLISLVTARKPLKTKRAVHVQIILIILAGLSIVLPSLSCVAVTQFRKDGLLPEWLNTMFVQIFVYSYVWAKHTVYLYPVIGSALRLLNVPAQQKPVCKDV